MPSIVFVQPVLWNSWADAALWDLLGIALWGSLFVSGVLTITGLVRRSPGNQLLAAVCSLPFCGLVAFMYTSWMLVVPLTQATLASMMVAVRRTHRTEPG